MAILVTWLGMVGWHVRREYFHPELARLASAALSLDPTTNFYTLQMNGRSVGLANSRLDTIPGGFLLDDLMTLELPALGQTGRAVARTQVRMSPALEMQSFTFSLDSEGGEFAAEGSMRGDSLLRVTVSAGGAPQEFEYRFVEPPLFSAILPIRLAMSGGLRVGRDFRFPVFDPSTLSTRTVEISVLEHDTLMVVDSVSRGPSGRWVPAREKTVPAWRVAERYGGMSVESWIDQDGRIVRATSALGFSMERTEYDLALQAQEDARGGGFASAGDIILNTAIRSNVELDDIESFGALGFRLKGVDLAGFELDGGRQSLSGDTLRVTRESWAQIDPGYTLPYSRMDLREALEAEVLIQSDDPRIRRAATGAVRGVDRRDPKEVARRLSSYVHDLLRKDVTFSVPSALQVLEEGAGDCNEHTVLYVALARSLGLPARTAVGLVYLDGSFFYHAWPEVWLGEWVAVDPTLGQVPAGAAHLRFVNGGLARQVEITRLIGNLDIEVLTGDERVSGAGGATPSARGFAPPPAVAPSPGFAPAVTAASAPARTARSSR
ncbi:MAG: transglutaminase-like domain-containing protein [Gemmatimonadota bacterium]